MKYAYSYIRFSSPEQLKGDSLRRQMHLTEAWCKRHGYVLNDTLKLRDLGVSAFRGRNAQKGALAVFLEGVERGKIKKGAVLIIERIDRITRQRLGIGLRLIMSILESGVKIATVEPERFYTDKSLDDLPALMELVIHLALAHDESAKKSERIKHSWERKRSQVTEKKLTGRCPAWLQLNEAGTSFSVLKERAAIVRRIFRMARDGMGSLSITKKLNADGIAPMGAVQRWHKSYGPSGKICNVLGLTRS